MRKMTLMLLAAATAMGVACSDSNNDSVTGVNVIAVDGVYLLQAVNGQTLPYLLYQQDSTTVNALDGHLEITTTGTWTEKVTVQTVSGRDTTTEIASASGVLFRSGNTLMFADLDNNPYYTGTATANRLDLNAGSATIVYTK